MTKYWFVNKDAIFQTNHYKSLINNGQPTIEEAIVKAINIINLDIYFNLDPFEEIFELRVLNNQKYDFVPQEEWIHKFKTLRNFS